MNQPEVFNKIGGIIKELNDQYKYIEAAPGDINELELELFVANAHFLAYNAEILTKLNRQNKTIEPPAEKPASVEKYFEPVVQRPAIKDKNIESLSETDDEPASIDLSSDTPEDSYSYIREEPEVIRHELVIDETGEWDDENERFVEKTEPVAEQKIEEPEPVKEEPTPVTQVKKEEPAPVKEDIKPIAKVKTDDKEEVFTINQKISAQLSNTGNRTEHIAAQQVSNLKQAINLNDKLLFIKDLFKGYSLAYSEAIDILNRFTTFEEAEEFLNKNYVAKNDWQSKPETIEKFYTLLKRRYV